jgi:CheY-like chemotaxis protein
MSKSRILIVDDDYSLSRLVGHLLQQTGRYEVRVENHSEAALQVAQEFLPDLFLLDVDMPGKDGGELSRDLKSVPAFAKKAFVFFTSLVTAGDAGGSEVMRGGQCYLAKTTDVMAITRCIDRVLATPVR